MFEYAKYRRARGGGKKSHDKYMAKKARMDKAGKSNVKPESMKKHRHVKKATPTYSPKMIADDMGSQMIPKAVYMKREIQITVLGCIIRDYKRRASLSLLQLYVMAKRIPETKELSAKSSKSKENKVVKD